jgi:hypothetical protein
MKMILLAVVIYASGQGENIAVRAASQEECVKQREKIVGMIENHNVKEPLKIVEFAVACVPAEKAPMGHAL